MLMGESFLQHRPDPRWPCPAGSRVLHTHTPFTPCIADGTGTWAPPPIHPGGGVSGALSAWSAVPLGARAWGWANRCTARKAQRKSACVSEPGDRAGPEECQRGLRPGKDKALRLTPPPAQHTEVGWSRSPGSIPGLGRSTGEGNGNPLQYSYLENPMDGGAW